jgi:hypothetical protein
MVVVVAHAIFESSGRPGRLDAPDEALGDEDAERVVHRLERDRADLRAGDRGHLVGGDVRLPRDGPQNGQPLGRHLNSVLTKQIRRAAGHVQRVAEILE